MVKRPFAAESLVGPAPWQSVGFAPIIAVQEYSRTARKRRSAGAPVASTPFATTPSREPHGRSAAGDTVRTGTVDGHRPKLRLALRCDRTLGRARRARYMPLQTMPRSAMIKPLLPNRGGMRRRNSPPRSIAPTPRGGTRSPFTRRIECNWTRTVSVPLARRWSDARFAISSKFLANPQS